METNNRNYINAVFNLDVVAFKNLLNTEPFDITMLQDIKFSEGIPCPIYWITQCWETIFEKPEEWKAECRKTIAANKRKNLEIKKIFEEKFNVVFEPIDFYNTNFWFNREERDASFEDVIYGGTRESMIAKGCRGIDLDLYVAVNKFDFKEVERLLKLGANPSYFLPEEENSCMDIIGLECSNLGMVLEGIIFDGKQSDPLASNAVDLINLLGLAANERMYALLSKYDLRNNSLY